MTTPRSPTPPRPERLPEEIVFFVRIGAYGFFVGIVYWFLTYEVAGAVMLTAFGAACLLLALLLFRGRRGRREIGAVGAASATAPDGPFGDERGRLPAPSFAPLELGFGLALASLSFAFGIWMAAAAVVPILAGGLSWLRSAERELAATTGGRRG